MSGEPQMPEQEPAPGSDTPNEPLFRRARPLTLQEVSEELGQVDSELAKLAQIRERLQQERASLEQLKRQRIEFEQGRSEVTEKLSFAVEWIEQYLEKLRRDEARLTRRLEELRRALDRVQAIDESRWDVDNYAAELGRSLSLIEQARLEWAAAAREWPQLGGSAIREREETERGSQVDLLITALQQIPFIQLVRLGVALSLPVLIVGLIVVVTLLVVR